MANEIEGIPGLRAKIQALVKETDPKFTGKVLRASLKPMLNSARSNAPVGDEAHRTYKGRLVAPGFLRKNIVLRKLKTKDKNNVGYGIWARGEAWYGQIVEAGRKGKSGNPWLGKAFNEHKDQVVDNFVKEESKKLIAATKRIKSR